MSNPSNRLATDEQILQAIKDHDSRRDAAKSLGIAYQTLKNRLTIIRQKAPKHDRPNTYSHKPVNRLFVSCVVLMHQLPSVFIKLSKRYVLTLMRIKFIFLSNMTGLMFATVSMSRNIRSK